MFVRAMDPSLLTPSSTNKVTLVEVAQDLAIQVAKETPQATEVIVETEVNRTEIAVEEFRNKVVMTRSVTTEEVVTEKRTSHSNQISTPPIKLPLHSEIQIVNFAQKIKPIQIEEEMIKCLI